MLGMMFSAGCFGRKMSKPFTIPIDGKYDSEFYSQSIHKEIEKIVISVKKLYCIVDYKDYYFPESANIRPRDLTDFFINKRAYSSQTITKSVIGTASIIYSDHDRIALMTCAHVLDFPDTIISYYDFQKEHVKSVAFKTKQENIVFDIPEADNFEILAMDTTIDLAILGKIYAQPVTAVLPVLPYSLGKSRDLEWGSLTYIFGYPLGNMMITRGLVSAPNRGKDGHFLLDALFNRGMSGGIILAIRDGLPNFEVVGMVKSVAADTRHLLVPDANLILPPEDIDLRYDGQAYVTYSSHINYGVTYPIPVEIIQQFFKRYHQVFLNKGYDFNSWYDKKR